LEGGMAMGKDKKAWGMALSWRDFMRRAAQGAAAAGLLDTRHVTL